MLRSLFRAPPAMPADDPGFAPQTIVGSTGSDGLGIGIGGRRRGLPTQVATACAIVKFLAGTQGALPRNIHRRNAPGRRAVRTPEFRHLWGRPNLDDNPMAYGLTFWTGIFASMEGWANGYTWIDRMPGTRDWRGVTGLHYYPPWYVRPFESGRDVRYQIGTDRQRSYGAADILHIIHGPALDGVRGVTPVEAGPIAHELAQQYEVAGAAMMREGIRPSGVVSVDGEVDEDTERLFQESWAAKYAGASRFGVVPLLGKGAKWVQTTIAPADAQYLEGREYQREEVLGLYAPGLPHHLLGWSSKTSNWGTGIEAQGRHLVQYVLMDRLLAVENMVNDRLLPDDLQLKFNVDGLLRGDSKQRTEMLRAMRQWGVLSADDWLEFEDMPPRGIDDDYLSPKNAERIDADSGEVLGVAPPAPPPPALPDMPPPEGGDEDGPDAPPPGGVTSSGDRVSTLLLEARCQNPACPSRSDGRRGALLATHVGTATLQCSHCKQRTTVRDGFAIRDQHDHLEAFLEELATR